MNKLISGVMLLGAVMGSGSALADPANIQYTGSVLTKSFTLSKGDVVTIGTSIPVNTRMLITMTANGHPNCTHCFNSSVMNVRPERGANFTDAVYAGANPGWLTYTYVGKEPTTFVMQIQP